MCLFCSHNGYTADPKPFSPISDNPGRSQKPLGWEQLEEIIKKSGASSSSISRKSPKSNIVEYNVSCPVCEHELKGQKLKHWDSENGVDTDFCRHSIGTSQYILTVITCCKCGYSARQQRFSRSATSGLEKFVKKNLTEKTRKHILREVNLKLKTEFIELSQKAIPPLLKYSNALSVAEFRKQNSLEIAKLCAEASWAMRIEFYRAPFSPLINRSLTRMSRILDNDNYSARDPENAVVFLKETLQRRRLSRTDLFLCNLFISSNYDRIGNLSMTKDYLDRAVTQAEGNKELTRIAEKKRLLLENEIRFREKAFSHYIQVLSSNGLSKKQLLPVMYLIGEMLRRNGQYQRAYFWLRGTEKILGSNESTIRILTTRQLGRVSERLTAEQKLKAPPSLLKTLVFEYGQ